MAKQFKNLMGNLSSERREKIEERAQTILMKMALQELRQTRHLTQQELANAASSFICEKEYILMQRRNRRRLHNLIKPFVISRISFNARFLL